MTSTDPETPSVTANDLLNHARSLFIYHAGQRLNSTRYFFAIYGVAFGGYITVLKEKGIDPALQQNALAAIAIFGALVALVYFLLDLRNAELVHVDENAMHFIEKQIVCELKKGANKTVDDYPNKRLEKLYTDGHPLLIARNMHKAPSVRWLRFGFTYAVTMKVVFVVLIVIPVAAVAHHAGFVSIF